MSEESLETPEGESPHQDAGVTRRSLFGAIAATGVGGLAAGAFGALALTEPAHGASTGSRRYAFAGPRQSGIVTPAQDRLHFATFDVAAGVGRAGLVALLQTWSAAAARMMRGEDVTESGAVHGSLLAPPDDTGEALGLPASGLTITFGFGPTLFVDASGADRFAIAGQRPDQLQPLPPFSGDALKAGISGGDLCIQACADDPQVAVHAIRNLTRIAFGTAVLRWSQLGFGRTSSTSTAQATPRNLFGFKDGTSNIKAEDRRAVEDFIWVQPGDGPDWLTGGSYLVTRTIRMLIELWDRTRLGEQQRIFGRDKGEGAPLSGGGEFTTPDFRAMTASGPAIDSNAHVQLAHPVSNGGRQILRRGYNYVNGNDDLGQLDAGLFFISYQRDLDQFITIQRSLSSDLLNEYIKHVGSGVFAIPPGPSTGGWVGETLFA